MTSNPGLKVTGIFRRLISLNASRGLSAIAEFLVVKVALGALGNVLTIKLCLIIASVDFSDDRRRQLHKQLSHIRDVFNCLLN